MLKKLRWRFILAAMLAFFFAIMLVAGLVNVVNYVVTTRRNDKVNEQIKNYGPYAAAFENPHNLPTPLVPFGALPNPDDNYMTRFFIVGVASDGSVSIIDWQRIASITPHELTSYASDAMLRESDKGYLDGFRFLKFEVGSQTIIIFLNCSKDIGTMRSLLYMSAIISVGALVLMFLLVLPLSKKAIQPIAQNIELQKRFITDASHELKTPLTSISTSLDVIELDRGPDEWTDNIRGQVSRMSGLVSQLVTLSRLDEVKPVPEKEQFDLSSAAWEILEVHSPQAKVAGKEVKTDIEENVTMTGEKASIQQMLSVLIENAIKYSDDNSEIRFSLNKSHGKIKIEIFNTCNYEKIPDTKRLFERFYRPDESRNSATGGNGIGLAIAKSVVEAHGGTIKAECPSGKTMTVTVEF
ncbi:MAG: HAMP domain-containing histidine kinase [Clostridia bacterium]|nr:HAMP domain-containing histidine kinase [Clostridia bacterium]